MQLLVNLLANSLYGEKICKDIEEKFAFKSECWMMSEYGERIKEYWKIIYGNYMVEMVDDKGLEDKAKKLYTMFFSWVCSL